MGWRVLIRLLVLLATATWMGAVVAVPIERYASAVSAIDGHTYAIYADSDTGHIRWTDARDLATGLGGYLTTITTEEEEAFLQGEFAGAKLKVGVTAWIGLSDATQEGNFQWVTGPDVGEPLGYADWRSGEPNNNGPSGNEDYVTWENYPLGPAGGAWNDVAEDELVSLFMVEFDPVLEFLSEPNPDNGHTYAIYRAGSFDNPISWIAAKNAAEVLGAYLATITSEAEERFVQSAFAGADIKIGVATWIGLSDAIEEDVFRWVTGPEAGQLLGYADWRTGEPNNNGPSGNEDYVIWENYPLGPAGGAWNDAAMDERVFRFMVEFPAASVPEPLTIMLFGLGLAGLGLVRRRRPLHDQQPNPYRGSAS